MQPKLADKMSSREGAVFPRPNTLSGWNRDKVQAVATAGFFSWVPFGIAWTGIALQFFAPSHELITMGRQLAIDLTEEEEQEFLSFLCKSANVQIIRTFARTPDALFIDSLDPRGPGNWSFYLWNTDFPWQPVLAQTRDDLPEPSRRGLYYFSNIDTAPALTYSRPVPDAGIAYGRIYWAKRFSTANGLNYDVEAFSEWYDRTARWLRALKAKAARTHTSQERTRKG